MIGRSHARTAGATLALCFVLFGQSQTAPPKPPAQRPPGKLPAAAIPPHPAPQTSPQTVQTLPAYEGQAVATVEIAGRPGLDAAPLLALLPQKAQQPFSRALVDQSIGTLKQQLAASNLQGVDLNVRPEPSGLRVQFILEPALYVGVYQFPGALQYSYTRLLEASRYTNQQAYSAHDIADAAAGVASYLQQEGYFQASVTPRLLPDPAHGLVNVRFEVQMGPRAQFGAIQFEGATAAQSAHLHDVVTSWLARLRRAAILEGKPYSLHALQSAASYLQGDLNSDGYLGAQVKLSGARYNRVTNRADVTFAVDAGPVVKLAVEGAHLWPWTRHNLVPIYLESRVDPELVQEGQENLANYFASKGYFNAVVTATTTSTAANGEQTRTSTSLSAATSATPPAPPPPPAVPPAAQTITYTVAKGPRNDVEEIQFRGDQFFSREDLLPQVAISPEGIFSHGSFSQSLLRTSVDNITSLYQASGYSSVQVNPVVSHPGGNLAVTFNIVEGPQDFVSTLQFEGNTLDPSLLAPDGLMLGPGTPFAQDLITQDRAHILAYYLSHGYLNATFRATAQRQPGQAHLIAVTYLISEGPRVSTATIITAGRQRTQQRYLDLATSNLKPDTSLTATDMLTAESRLYAPGIFDWAEVAPRRPITTQDQADVVVKVHEARPNELTYGFGFDLTNRGGSIPSGTVALPGLPIVGLPSTFKTSQATFYGPSASLEYTRLNLRGKAETFSAGVFAGRLDQHGSLTFTDPDLFWSRFSGNLVVSAEHDSQNPIFTSKIGQVGYQLERPLNPDKTTNLFLRYSFSETVLSRLLIPALVPARDQHVRLSTLAASFVRDTRDNPLDAHRGLLESYELDYSAPAIGASADFGKLLTQTAYYKQIPANIIWANSLRLGLARAFGGSFVPLSQEFFSGGGSTLRGFPLDGAGPQNTIPACGNPSDPATCSLIRVPVGGNELLILNSELRIPAPQIYKNVGFALFYDGGNVFSHVGFTNLHAGFSNTLGVGLRYQTAVGPIRIDLGHNLNALSGIKATQLFITLGQAF